MEDYLRLGCIQWLDDSAIEAFFNTVVMKSTLPADRRFIIIGSQHWKFAQGEDDAELYRMKRCIRGFPAYNVDIVLSPYNVSDAHWILTKINVHEQTITIINPWDSTNDSKNPNEGVILKRVKTIFEACAEQFDVQQQWKFVS